MARGDKNYNKVVRKHNKGGKASARKKAVHNMVENIIQGDMDAASDDLRTAVQLISREIILGEAADEKKDEVKDKDDDDIDDDESDEYESDDEESDDEESDDKDDKN